MKVTLDLDALLKAGKITSAERAHLLALSSASEAKHFANILKVFGILAVMAGVYALAPSLFNAAFQSLEAALGLPGFFLLVAVACFTAGLRFQSGFLMALSALFLPAAFLTIDHAKHTIKMISASRWALLTLQLELMVLCGVASGLAFRFAALKEKRFERPLIIFARVSLICALAAASLPLSDALVDGLLGVGIVLGVGGWGAWKGDRFVVNTAASFGAILFFFYYLKIFGYGGVSLIGAGMFGFAMGWLLLRYRRNQSS
ncbi:MAG: hypothetical protein EOP11_18345 [Proteobacteria bacterium]|nr:MAG: hypothetical protein EOP11_18345 [Pseudomonadota bacterium]